MTRAFLVVMDSVGVGGAPDAHEFFNGATPLGTGTLTRAASVRTFAVIAAGSTSTRIRTPR